MKGHTPGKRSSLNSRHRKIINKVRAFSTGTVLHNGLLGNTRRAVPQVKVLDDVGTDVTPLPLLLPTSYTTLGHHAGKELLSQQQEHVPLTANGGTAAMTLSIIGSGLGWTGGADNSQVGGTHNSSKDYFANFDPHLQQFSATGGPTTGMQPRPPESRRAASLHIPLDNSSETSTGYMPPAYSPYYHLATAKSNHADLTTSKRHLVNVRESEPSEASTLAGPGVHGTGFSTVQGVLGGLGANTAFSTAQPNQSGNNFIAGRGPLNKSMSSHDDSKTNRFSSEFEDCIYTEPPDYSDGFFKNRLERQKSQKFLTYNEEPLDPATLEEMVEIVLQESETAVLLNMAPSSVYKSANVFEKVLTASVADEDADKTSTMSLRSFSVNTTTTRRGSVSPTKQSELQQQLIDEIKLRNKEYLDFKARYKEPEEYVSTTVQTINRSRKVKFCQTLRVQKRESGAQVNEADIYDEMARFDEEIDTFQNHLLFAEDNLFLSKAGVNTDNRTTDFSVSLKKTATDSVIANFTESVMESQLLTRGIPSRLLIKWCNASDRGSNLRSKNESSLNSVSKNVFTPANASNLTTMVKSIDNSSLSNDSEVGCSPENSSDQAEARKILESERFKDSLLLMERMFSWNQFREELFKILGAQGTDSDYDYLPYQTLKTSVSKVTDMLDNSNKDDFHDTSEVLPSELGLSDQPMEQSYLLKNPVPDTEELTSCSENPTFENVTRFEEIILLKCDLVDGLCVNAITRCRSNTCIFAVGYGAKSFNARSRGAVLVWNLKNVLYPERHYSFDDSVTSVRFGIMKNNLLAVGFQDGSGCIINFIDTVAKIMFTNFDAQIIKGLEDNPVTNASVKQSEQSSVLPQFKGLQSGLELSESKKSLQKHSSPVWHMVWVTSHRVEGSGDRKEENLISVGADGRVIKWSREKDFVYCTSLTRLKKTIQSGAGGLPGSSNRRSSSGSKTKLPQKIHLPISPYTSILCADASPLYPDQLLMATSDGTIQRVCCSYEDKILETYTGHHGEVFKAYYSPFNPAVFISCSADWSIRLWQEDSSEAFLVISPNQKEAVLDVSWSPVKSTVFASTSSKTVNLYDLSNDLVDPVASFRLPPPGPSKSDEEKGDAEEAEIPPVALFTTVSFLTGNSLLIGDSSGKVRVIWVGLDSILVSASATIEHEKLQKLIIDSTERPTEIPQGVSAQSVIQTTTVR